jgi:hypothetical protein
MGVPFDFCYVTTLNNSKNQGNERTGGKGPDIDLLPTPQKVDSNGQMYWESI